ncbi:hypothetical protein ONZ45_g11110 [Pleurotus djamor]|nr:hypothetical protein ONZ45_g11110 [Pleurotus djamor]
MASSDDTTLDTGLGGVKFRVLIIGKANAGKTTILQKVCNTTEQPVVMDSKGQLLDPAILEPSKGRGEHDINLQYVFKSQDRFVFHDSRGFEAGSTQELDAVKQFIAERASHPHLNLRLHVVWFCIPTDTPRILLEGETSFFEECRKSHVPVVAIFTKFDFRHHEAIAALLDEGLSRPEARRAAPERAKTDFEKIYMDRLYSRAHPPSSHVFLYGMQKPSADCTDLIRATAASLKGSNLQSLLISTQMNRIHLCVEYALRHILENIQRKTGDLRRHEMKDIVFNCMIWFPLDQVRPF